MSKMTWNKFVKAYPDAMAFTAAVSGSFPMSFDANKQKLPTPYGLFVEWFGKIATADWASSRLPGGFAIRLSSLDDAKRIVARYPAITQLKDTAVANKTAQIRYGDRDYLALAKELGYVLPQTGRP